LFNPRPVSWRSALPISFMPAPYERSLSVTMACGRPWRFIAILMNFSAAALPLSYETKDSSTSPSWSTARQR
jgi:hypothetical protein